MQDERTIHSKEEGENREENTENLRTVHRKYCKKWKKKEEKIEEERTVYIVKKKVITREEIIEW